MSQRSGRIESIVITSKWRWKAWKRISLLRWIRHAVFNSTCMESCFISWLSVTDSELFETKHSASAHLMIMKCLRLVNSNILWFWSHFPTPWNGICYSECELFGANGHDSCRRPGVAFRPVNSSLIWKSTIQLLLQVSAFVLHHCSGSVWSLDPEQLLAQRALKRVNYISFVFWNQSKELKDSVKSLFFVKLFKTILFISKNFKCSLDGCLHLCRDVSVNSLVFSSSMTTFGSGMKPISM
jgi:hypothetical protein